MSRKIILFSAVIGICVPQVLAANCNGSRSQLTTSANNLINRSIKLRNDLEKIRSILETWKMICQTSADDTATVQVDETATVQVDETVEPKLPLSTAGCNVDTILIELEANGQAGLDLIQKKITETHQEILAVASTCSLGPKPLE